MPYMFQCSCQRVKLQLNGTLERFEAELTAARRLLLPIDDMWTASGGATAEVVSRWHEVHWQYAMLIGWGRGGGKGGKGAIGGAGSA